MNLRLCGLGVALLIIAGSLACVQKFSAAMQLRRDLQEQYRDAKIEVAFVNGLRHLELTFDAPSFRELSESQHSEKAMEIGRFAVDHYAQSTELDSITIAFVLEQTGAPVLRITKYVSRSFAKSDLR